MARLTAVAYARYSSDKQQESSITVQLAAIHKFCDAHNIHLLHEYVDEAQTGTNANRKQFQEMITAALDREFQFVVVHRMDRWARNVDDARHYKKLLGRYGIKIISAVEEFDESPEGEFFELLSMGMAELYSKKLARESYAGQLANARLGKVHGGMPMLGYAIKGKYYVIEEKEAEAVKIIFDMAARGEGYRTIQRYLKDNGYRRADGREYTAHFTDILRCRQYIGEYIFNRMDKRDSRGKRNFHKEKSPQDIIRIPNGMPRIIDDETFYKVQKILDMRKRGMAGYQRMRRKYPLSGLIRCKKCGFALCGSLTRNHGRDLTVYQHSRVLEKCQVKRIPTTYLDDYVIRLLTDCLLNPSNVKELKELVKMSYGHTMDAFTDKRKAVLEKIEELKQELKATATNLAENDIRTLSNYYTEEIERLNYEIRMKETEVGEIEQDKACMPVYNPLPITRRAEKYRADLYRTTGEEKQELLQELIQVVRVDNDTVEVTVKFQKLLGADYPILATVIEVRNHVARLDEWEKRVFEFSKLTVRLES